MGMPSVKGFILIRMPSLPSGVRGHSCAIHSLRAESPRGQWPGGRLASGSFNSLEQGSSLTHRCEKLATHGSSSSSSEGVSVGQSVRQELQGPVAVVRPEKASDFLESTSFFLDELIEAKATVKKLLEQENSMDPFNPLQEEEPSEQKEDEERENGDILKDSESSGLRKLPIESNGPPMVILERYLRDDAEEQGKAKLRHLPLPMPHKGRSPGLPRPSLRRRLGIAYSRKLPPADQDKASSPDS